VHGANRLASNSLTESVVAGTRVGRDLAWELPGHVEPAAEDVVTDAAATDVGVPDRRLLDPARTTEVRAVMSRHVAVLRDAASLATAAGALGAITRGIGADVVPSRPAWEGTNLLTVAGAVVAAATARTESRGCHRRTDHPDSRDVWLTHLDVGLGPVGELDVDGIPAGA
jgi:L-aspartate oxidase